MRKNNNEWPTIRQYAKVGPWSEHYLRLMLAQGKLPGIYVGSHFRINRAALEAQMDVMSRQEVQL